MPNSNPSVISRAVGIFTDYLCGTVTGEMVLGFLESTGDHRAYGMERFTFIFDEEHRSDFEALLVPPYLDCLKEAVSQIDQNVSLKCAQDEASFEHSPDGIEMRRIPAE